MQSLGFEHVGEFEHVLQVSQYFTLLMIITAAAVGPVAGWSTGSLSNLSFQSVHFLKCHLNKRQRCCLRRPVHRMDGMRASSFPRKMANVFRMFAQDPFAKTIGRTAALSYPNRRAPSVHHKKKWPSAATSHESRPGKPSFCIFGLPHWDSPQPEVGQITRNTGLGKLLG